MSGYGVSDLQRRALLRAALVGVAAPGLLASCGGGGGSGGSGAGGSSPNITTTPVAPPVAVSLAVSPNPSGRVIDSTFGGLSYEKGYLSLVSSNTLASPPAPLLDANNQNLVNLFKRLGPSVLRIGGSTADTTLWKANGPGLIYGQVAPSDIDRLSAFVAAVNWKVIYALNFVYNDPATMAAEAAYAATAFGARLLGFELGNEPDLYGNTAHQVLAPTLGGFTALNGLAQANYTYADFLAQWTLYAAAIRASVPNAPLAGPVSAIFPNPFNGGLTNLKGGTFSGQFALDQGAGLALLTQHYYLDNDITTVTTAANGVQTTTPDWQVPTGAAQAQILNWMLTPDAYLAPGMQSLAAAAATIPGGCRIAEANSFFEGGMVGLTYSLAAALWALDFMFVSAQSGATGVNFHSGYSGGTLSAGVTVAPAGQTPISDDYTKNEGGQALPPGFTPIIDDLTQTVVAAGPEYYALYLFSLAAKGQLQTVAVTNAAGLLLSAYAVAGGDGSQYVMVLNKDQTTTAQVSLQLNAAAQQASLTTLSSTLTGSSTPSLQSGDGLTLNGAPIGPDGGWSPAAAPTVAVTGGRNLSFSVGPASAVLLKAS